MSLFNPTLFLAALREILKSGVAAITLTEEEIVFLANDSCPKEHQLPIAAYRDYAEQLTLDLPADLAPTANAEAYYEIFCVLRAEQLKQKLAMLNAIAEGKPNWRRFCWLLERKNKEARLNKMAAKKPVVAKVPPAPVQPLRKVETQQVEKPVAEKPLLGQQLQRPTTIQARPISNGHAISQTQGNVNAPAHSGQENTEENNGSPNMAQKLAPHVQRYMRH